MRLGFAVKVLGDGGLPSHDTRRWQSGPHLSRSLDFLDGIFSYLERNAISMYRMATAVAPYASHPDMPQFWDQIPECAARLAEVGTRARALVLRLSVHPGQYTVLNSENLDVQANAVRELEVQASLLDAMDLGPEAVVVVHVGGMAGGPTAALDRFLAGFERLSERARARLVVENDDRLFSLAHVLDLHARTSVPVTFDVLHHHCNDPDRIPLPEALRLALDTWPADVVPKIHFSSPQTQVLESRVKTNARMTNRYDLPAPHAHSDLIDPMSFEAFLTASDGAQDFDVMLEAKAKDLALLRLRDSLRRRGFDVG
ncbi:MAG TPA: UV DNA damage repair endonuclease UvsE [Actinomycetota bacterium]|nr:UV DNA damage repair endonuclease UvsE [Actinomycetota bacterium]